MTTSTYAGIGARATPRAVLSDMTKMAGWLARTGWHLNTGGAKGADSAFSAGAPSGLQTLFLPWRGYNGLDGADCLHLTGFERDVCMDYAARLHPAWDRCSPGARLLHGRNVALILGPELTNPVDAVVAWSERGEAVGGTGMGIRIAEDRGIPVLNLGSMSPRAVCERLRDIRRAAPVSGSER
ncbi:MAG: hypothetical protein OXI64_07520 [Defluviicoccus sp.]|nr:hypothetical protein [Defluviicoccus sp.]